MNSPESGPQNEGRAEATDVSIERAGVADLETIQKLNQELCAKEHTEYDETINPDYPFTEKGEAYFKGRIESEDGFVVLAKDESGTPVGYLVGGMAHPEDYRTVESFAELENMFVGESARGKGVGGKLVNQFREWCNERNVQIIRIEASAENTEAIEFYKRHGSKVMNVTLEMNLDTDTEKDK